MNSHSSRSTRLTLGGTSIDQWLPGTRSIAPDGDFMVVRVIRQHIEYIGAPGNGMYARRRRQHPIPRSYIDYSGRGTSSSSSKPQIHKRIASWNIAWTRRFHPLSIIAAVVWASVKSSVMSFIRSSITAPTAYVIEQQSIDGKAQGCSTIDYGLINHDHIFESTPNAWKLERSISTLLSTRVIPSINAPKYGFSFVNNPFVLAAWSRVTNFELPEVLHQSNAGA